MRGRPGEDLTRGLIQEVTQGFAAFLVEQRRPLVVAVGHDSRSTSPKLAAAVGAEARRAGLDTVALGAASTPAAKQYYVRRGLGGAIIVTASHLAPELNGLKLVSGDLPCPVHAERLPGPRRVKTPGRSFTDHCAPDDHLRALVGVADVDRIRRAGMTATCTGGIGDTAERLLRTLEVRPGSELEFRLDADGDRLSVKGMPPDAVLLAAVASSRPHHLVAGADTSRAVDRLLPGRVNRVAPGELHLVRGMARIGAPLAGEGNGGVIREDLTTGRDGLGTALLLLELLAREAKSFSQVLESLPPIHVRRTTIALDCLHERAGELPGAVDLGALRGVELLLEHGAWALIRASATEPVGRVTVEGPDEHVIDELLRDLLKKLEA